MSLYLKIIYTELAIERHLLTDLCLMFKFSFFYSLEAISDFMVAFNVQKQPMFGCFHPERVGKLSTDVHIIDLQVSSHSTSAFYNR